MEALIRAYRENFAEIRPPCVLARVFVSVLARTGSIVGVQVTVTGPFRGVAEHVSSPPRLFAPERKGWSW